MNPLSKHFRHPALFLSLPSNGKFYPEGTLEPNETGEYPVLPMTALDEITYRTPDSLFNGTATVEVIKSCIPSIKDPWQMPNIDLDAALIAIRVASYGKQMDIDSVCPHCQNENSFGLDLTQILGQLRSPDYNSTLKIGDLEFFFVPISYKDANDNAIAQFEEQRVLQAAVDNIQNVPQDRLSQALKNLTAVTFKSIVDSISGIKIDDTLVTDKSHINEYIRNVDSETFKMIRDHINHFRDEVTIKPLHITCQNSECQKEYDTPFTLDHANFFGQGS